VPAPEGLTGEVTVVLSVAPVFNPKQMGISQDDRELGVLVKRLGFVPDDRNNGVEEAGSLASRIAETQSQEFMESGDTR
jgi:hypothetical protein